MSPARPNTTKSRFDGLLPFAALDAPSNCPVCAQATVTFGAPYPYAYEDHFRDAATRWCVACGSGHVVGGDELIRTYYETEYAEVNRGDRDLPPAQYFQRLLRSSGVYNYYAHRAFTHAFLLRNNGARFEDVLDYGSGPGYFLHLSGAKRKFAVEPDSHSAKYLNHIGAELLKVDDLPENAFDVVVSSHSIEHLTETTLRPVVDKLIASLKIGGMMLVEAPNAGLSYLRLTYRHEPHTLFFTPEGLRRSVERPSVTVTRWRARGDFEWPLRPEPIYSPAKGDRFRSTCRGDLVVIVRRDA